jgi:hypothetical protein
MKVEDVGPPQWRLGRASCWPPFVSLCPLLYLLRAALTRLVGFTFKP